MRRGLNAKQWRKLCTAMERMAYLGELVKGEYKMHERPYKIGIGSRDSAQVYNRETEDRVMQQFLEGSAGRRAEVDELIARGWGTTDAAKIPANWREIEGPEIARDRKRASFAERQSKAEEYHKRKLRLMREYMRKLKKERQLQNS